MFTDNSNSLQHIAQPCFAAPLVAIHHRKGNWVSTKAIADAAAFVSKGGFKRVAVQLPDDWLPHAVALCSAIEESIAHPAKVFVLADSTFGSCCPDEVTAMHYGSDCIIHCGTACLSRVMRLPVFYVHSSWQSNSEPAASEQLPVLCSTPAQQNASRGDMASSTRAVSYFLSSAAERRAHVMKRGQEWKPVEIVLVQAPGVALDSVGMWSELEASLNLPGGIEALQQTAIVTIASPSPSAVQVDGLPKIAEWNVNGVSFPRRSRGCEISAQCFVLLVPRLVGNASSRCSPPGASSATVDEAAAEADVAAFAVFPQLAQLRMILMHNQLALESPQDGDDDDNDVAAREWNTSRRNILVAAECSSSYLVDLVDVSTVSRLVSTRIRQRRHNLEVIKAAESVGIVVASLAILGYRETTFLLRDVLRRIAKKRCYVIYIGHINEFKLANFVDSVDCFCVIACPNSRTAHYPLKSDNFMKPLVQPSEVVEALFLDAENPRQLSASDVESEAFRAQAVAACYTPDFTAVAPVLKRYLVALDQEEDRSPPTPSDALVVSSGRGGALVSLGGAGGALQRLAQRTYRGLEPLLGETPVQQAVVDGRSGIARGYQTEKAPSGTLLPSLSD